MAPRTVTELGEQAVEHARKSATEATLWDKAYIALKDEGNNRIAKYEDLLSRVLLRGLCSSPSPPSLPRRFATASSLIVCVKANERLP